jgi:hypothetical protein
MNVLVAAPDILQTIQVLLCASVAKQGTTRHTSIPIPTAKQHFQATLPTKTTQEKLSATKESTPAKKELHPVSCATQVTILHPLELFSRVFLQPKDTTLLILVLQKCTPANQGIIQTLMALSFASVVYQVDLRN